MEGEITEVGGSLLCLLLLHHANPSQEKAKKKALGITKYTEDCLLKEGISKKSWGN